MWMWLKVVFGTLQSSVRNQRELSLENLALRQQLATLKLCRPYCAAGDSDSLASAGILLLLAVEEPTPRASPD